MASSIADFSVGLSKAIFKRTWIKVNGQNDLFFKYSLDHREGLMSEEIIGIGFLMTDIISVWKGYVDIEGIERMWKGSHLDLDFQNEQGKELDSALSHSNSITTATPEADKTYWVLDFKWKKLIGNFSVDMFFKVHCYKIEDSAVIIKEQVVGPLLTCVKYFNLRNSDMTGFICNETVEWKEDQNRGDITMTGPLINHLSEGKQQVVRSNRVYVEKMVDSDRYGQARVDISLSNLNFIDGMAYPMLSQTIDEFERKRSQGIIGPMSRVQNNLENIVTPREGNVQRTNNSNRSSASESSEESSNENDSLLGKRKREGGSDPDEENRPNKKLKSGRKKKKKKQKKTKNPWQG